MLWPSMNATVSWAAAITSARLQSQGAANVGVSAGTIDRVLNSSRKDRRDMAQP